MLTAGRTIHQLRQTCPLTDTKIERHIIACEFPPTTGGVGDYTYYLAKELSERGEDVHVWCPEAAESYPELPGVTVHGVLGGISVSKIHRLDHHLNGFDTPRRILVQWVPHGYKYKSLNLPFCFWVLKRAVVNNDKVDLMVHEPFLRFRGNSWKHLVAATIHRIMIFLLLAAASNVWLATSSWEALLRPYCFNRKARFSWLPVPSNIPVAEDEGRVTAIRQQYCPGGGLIIGHFGTYGRAIVDLVTNVLEQILQSPNDPAVLLMGRNSFEFRHSLLAAYPQWAGRVYAVGRLNGAELSHHIQACDLMIQPYPDGITTRRGSAMAALAHGRAIVSTSGNLTEPFWLNSNAVAMAPIGNIQELVRRVQELLCDARQRTRFGAAARTLYINTFDIVHTVEAIRSDVGGDNRV